MPQDGTYPDAPPMSPGGINKAGQTAEEEQA